MGSVMKVLTGILGILAVIACLSTIGIIGYTVIGGGGSQKNTAGGSQTESGQTTDIIDAPSLAPVPTILPDTAGNSTDQTPADISDDTEKHSPSTVTDHVHDYKETVEKKATCYQAGKLKYTCEICGDVYYVDTPSTGHVAEDNWETVRTATADRDGLRVKKCIYCDEVVAQEVIPYSGSGASATPHVHDYIASVEREPSCVLAGLRKYTCSCGSFYTESIPAMGHIATDWTVVEAATEKQSGTEQRTCTVCGVVLDTRSIPPVTPSASPSASTGTATATPSATAGTSASPSGSAAPTATPTVTPSAVPTATPHVHHYTSYVLQEANCTQPGIRSYVCSCGSTYAEQIPIDPNNHDYRAVVIPPTATSAGYTLYRCSRCNATYMDNYTQPTGQ